MRAKAPRSISFGKAISWRVTGSVDTFIIAFLFIENAHIAGGIALAEWATKTVLYYFHERIWERWIARSTLRQLKTADPTEIQDVSFGRGNIWWMTGYSGAGKTTLGRVLFEHLKARGRATVFVDGDSLRSGLNQDLGFDDKSRSENTRRASEVAVLLASQGMDVVVCVIAPFAEDRARARKRAPGAFYEIFVDASLDICKSRDPKGLYKRVSEGKLEQFTGIASRYEIPANPDLRIDTGHPMLEQSIQLLMEYVEKASKISIVGNPPRSGKQTSRPSRAR